MKNTIDKILEIVEKEMEKELTEDVEIAITPSESVLIVVTYYDPDPWMGTSVYELEPLNEYEIQDLIDRLKRRFACVEFSKFYHDLVPNKLTLQYLIIVRKMQT